jgi:hypothetical protein
MSDTLERFDALLGAKLSFLYPSSLLYLVSGLFEHAGGAPYSDAPLLGMERFIGKATAWVAEPEEAQALDEIRAFLSADPNRVIYSESSGGSGLNCLSKSHGGFDDDPDTLASIIAYIS